MAGITLDAGALIALDRNDRQVIVLLARALETNARVTIPASALAICARRTRQRVVTSDPDDLSRLDPTLEFIVV